MSTRVADGYGDFANVQDGPKFVESRRSFTVEGIAESVRNFATLSEALRILGAAVLVASMSVFLLQGWNEGNDINRYLLLLAQTGLLSAAGFAMSHGLKETKGARIFFGLALISIPANFTILGALLYSVFQWDAGLANYPAYAHWEIESLAGTGLTFGGALLVLVPVTLFCFAIMARQSSKSLTLHFLLLNALLLLPIRGSLIAGSIGLAGVVYALFVLGRLSQRDRSLKTGEGKFALATLFIPIGIILFRSMYFYQVDSLMVAMVALAVFLAARQVSLFPDRSQRLATLLEAFSMPVALVVAVAMTDAFAPMLADGLAAPMFATIYALLSLDIVRRTNSQVLMRVIGMTISISTMLSFSLSLVSEPSAITALLCLGAGVLLVLSGSAMRKHFTTFCGLATLAAAVLFGFEPVFDLIMDSSWIDLALFGATAIALGSVIERHGVVLKLRLVRWFDSVNSKQADPALTD